MVQLRFPQGVGRLLDGNARGREVKLLGVDFGQRRVGLAVADDVLRIASPLRSVPIRSAQEASDAVCEAVRETGAGQVILGHPRNLDGRVGPKAKEAEGFADSLRAEAIDVVLWDERLTTREAEVAMREARMSRKQRMQAIDAVAAQRILQSYLDANSGRPPDIS